MKFFTIFLVLGACVAASKSVHAEQEITKIERIVITYNTSNDWNSSNAMFYQHLSRLLDAAKEKNVEVVFYPANKTTEEFKANLQRLSQEKNTWIILSSHGGQITNNEGITDTSLSFGGEILVTDLKPILEHKNVKGLMVSSCHAFSDVVSKMTPVNCGVSPSDKVGIAMQGRHYFNGLAELVRSPDAIDPVKVLKKSIKDNIEKDELSKTVLRSFNSRTGPDGELQALVDGDMGQLYVFEGKGYKEIDHSGAPVVLCNGSHLFSNGSKFVDALKPYGNPENEPKSNYKTYKDDSPPPTRIGFLPETVVQPDLGRVASRYFTFPMDRLNLLGQKLYCGKDGKWSLKGTSKDQCYGLWTNIETCQIEPISDNVSWAGETNDKIDCAWLREFRNNLVARNVDVPQNMCVTGCTIDRNQPRVQIFPGQCDPKGEGYRCLANLSYLSEGLGSGGIQDEKCCDTKSKAHLLSNDDSILSCKNQCYDEISDKVVQKGACFYSDHEAKRSVFDQIKYKELGSNFKELQAAATIEKSLRSPIYQCDTHGQGRVSEDCCKKAGRKWELTIFGHGCVATAQETKEDTKH